MSPETLAQQHHHYHPLRVARVVPETADARSFVVEVPPELAAVFRYQAGQYLTFKISFEGKELLRCYSLSSCPDTDREHKVTVKRIADGRISNWLNDHLREGDTLRVLPPAGRFVLRQADCDLLLFSGGSGITPVLSLIKSALLNTRRRMKLVYANRDEASIIFRAELDRLAASHPGRLEVVHSLDVRDGFLTRERVRAHLAGREGADVYICGPSAFMDVVEDTLDEAGQPRERRWIERFVSPEDPDAHKDDDPARAAAAEQGGAGCETLVVTVDGQTHEIPYPQGRTVLQAAREAGLQPPFSCEDGYCSCCMAKLRDGEVAMRKNDCLTERDLSDGWVLTCQSVPQTRKVTIDWDAS